MLHKLLLEHVVIT